MAVATNPSTFIIHQLESGAKDPAELLRDMVAEGISEDDAKAAMVSLQNEQKIILGWDRMLRLPDATQRAVAVA